MTIPAVLATGTALPNNRVSQPAVFEMLDDVLVGCSRTVLERYRSVFDNAGIEHRSLCRPADWYARERTFDERNAVYQDEAVQLGVAAARLALCRAELDPGAVGSVVFVSNTGLATPSLDVAVMSELGVDLRHTNRQAIFGRGCAGGAVGLAAAADRVRLDPNRASLLVVVELSSLAFRRRDSSTTNIVASALFGDGAAAAVLGTNAEAALRVIGHDQATWPDTGELMGWAFGADGMTIALDRRVPSFVRHEFATTVQEACERFAVDRIDHYVIHPGSNAVLDAVAESVGIDAAAFSESQEVLRTCGNMSAATVLLVLDRFIGRDIARPGDTVLLSAMGPGFTVDHVLLRC
jgi:alkylresorcinol/alkylpyrone synthase